MGAGRFLEHPALSRCSREESGNQLRQSRASFRSGEIRILDSSGGSCLSRRSSIQGRITKRLGSPYEGREWLCFHFPPHSTETTEQSSRKKRLSPSKRCDQQCWDMTRKLSGQKRAVLGAGKLGGHSSSRLSQAGAVFAKACERNGTPRR